MRIHNILLVTIIVVYVSAMPTIARGLSNGWEQILNINDPMVQEIARWAVAEHAKQANDGLQFKSVVSGMLQVVSGKNFKLRIDAVNSDGKEAICIAEV
jgi:hypothetical protein